MSLLNKFASVEIKADNRISDDDKVFCLRHQEAFDKSGPALQKIAELMQSGSDEQRTILAVDDDHFYNPYMSGDGFSCDTDNVYRMMQKRNRNFIFTIVHYFSQKYNVDLDEREIEEHLIPVAPKEPELPWGGYRDMSDEEIDAFQEKLAAHKVKQTEYDTMLRTLPLRYEQIVDEIFVQLGGFSFQEQAMNEFIERTWKCCHRSWGNNEERFEIKNDTLRLTGSWCSCDDRWSWGPEWKPDDDLKTLLDALAWYECGRMNEGRLWFPNLQGYSVKQNEFPICNMEKVKFIKLFKNGRVDIKFRNAAYVQEFVEQCMRRKVT